MHWTPRAARNDELALDGAVAPHVLQSVGEMPWSAVSCEWSPFHNWTAVSIGIMGGCIPDQIWCFRQEPNEGRVWCLKATHTVKHNCCSCELATRIYVNNTRSGPNTVSQLERLHGCPTRYGMHRMCHNAQKTSHGVFLNAAWTQPCASHWHNATPTTVLPCWLRCDNAACAYYTELRVHSVWLVDIVCLIGIWTTGHKYGLLQDTLWSGQFRWCIVMCTRMHIRTVSSVKHTVYNAHLWRIRCRSSGNTYLTTKLNAAHCIKGPMRYVYGILVRTRCRVIYIRETPHPEE